jgi:hypothetical protein
MKLLALWMCVVCLAAGGSLAAAQPTEEPALEPTATMVPWPTLTLAPGEGFPGLPAMPTPVGSEYVPHGFQAISRPYLYALLIHLAQTGVLFHAWVYSRFDSYITPLEAVLFFLLIWFMFRRKLAKYVGAVLPGGDRTTLVREV